MFTLLGLLTQHLTASLLDDGGHCVNVVDKPVDTDSSLTGKDKTARVIGFLNTSSEIERWVEIEHSNFILWVSVLLVLLERHLEDFIVKLGS